MNTTLIIAAFLGLWLVLFIPFMIVNAKRKKKAESFVSGNNDKAVIHLYCKNIKINGQNISVFNPVTGEGLATGSELVIDGQNVVQDGEKVKKVN